LRNSASQAATCDASIGPVKISHPSGRLSRHARLKVSIHIKTALAPVGNRGEMSPLSGLQRTAWETASVAATNVLKPTCASSRSRAVNYFPAFGFIGVLPETRERHSRPVNSAVNQRVLLTREFESFIWESRGSSANLDGRARTPNVSFETESFAVCRDSPQILSLHAEMRKRRELRLSALTTLAPY